MRILLISWLVGLCFVVYQPLWVISSQILFIYIYIYIYIYKYKSKVKLVTLVEGDPKAPFSIAITPRCRRGRYSFLWIAPLYSWYLPYNAELSKKVSSTIFWVFGMTRPGIEPWFPGSLVNTLLIKTNIKVVNLVTLVEGDSKAPFSIATTPKCWGRHHSIPLIASLYPWALPYNAEC